MAAKLTRLTQNCDTTATSGRKLYYLQFSLQAVSPETFGYTLVGVKSLNSGHVKVGRTLRKSVMVCFKYYTNITVKGKGKFALCLTSTKP
jgi:hypothetical protein